MRVGRLRFIGPLVLLMTLPLFQNCSEANLRFNAETLTSNGNGDGYQGKLLVFNYVDSQNPCVEQAADGRRLANEQIQLVDKRIAQRTRIQCADVAPQALALDEITLATDSSSIQFKGRTYLPQSLESDLSIVQAQCPAGLSPLPTPQRKNLFRNAWEIAQPSYYFHPGIQSDLAGSVFTIPKFRIARVEPISDSYWFRASRLFNLKASNRYAFSFIVEQGGSDRARVHIWQYAGADVILSVDLRTGMISVEQTTGVGDFSVVSSEKGAGHFVTVYFSAQKSAEADIGVAPFTSKRADSIFLTGFQLEDLDSFCR